MVAKAHQPLRIYSISLPKPVGVLPWIVLVGGALIVLTFEAFCLAAGPGLFLLPSQVTYLVVGARFCGALSVPLFIWQAFREFHRRQMQLKPRLDRIRSISEEPDFPKRLPHRLVELAACKECLRWNSSHRSIERATSEALLRCPTGCIMISNYPRETLNIAPIKGGRWFEATPLREVASQPITQSLKDGNSVSIRCVRRFSRTAGAPPFPAVILLVVFLLLPLLMFAAVLAEKRGYLSGASFFLALVTFSVLVVCLHHLWRTGVLGKSELLVPGGLVVARSPMWRRIGVAYFAHRENAAFLVDMFTRHTDIAIGDRVIRVRATRHIISTLINTSRTPTRDEIASFLGPKYVVRD